MQYSKAVAVCLLVVAVSGVPVVTNAQSPDLKAQLHTRFKHNAAARDIAFTPDGQLIVSSSADSTVQIRSVQSGKIVRTLRHPEALASMAVSADGKLIATGSYGGVARLWRIADGKLLRTLNAHDGTVWSVAFHPSGDRIATSGEDHMVKLWRVSDGTLLHTLRGHTLNVWTTQFNPDGKTLASSSFDRTIRIWNVDDGKPIRTLTGHTQAVVGFSISPDGKTLVSGSDDSSVKIWRVSDGALIRTIEVGNHVYHIAHSSDGRYIAGAGRERGAIGTLWRNVGPEWMHRRNRTTVRVWRATDGELLLSLSEHAGNASDVAFSPDGQWLATSGENGEVLTFRLSHR